MTPFDVISGDSPLVLAQPHGGTWVPDDLMDRLNDTGRGLSDTDWHIDSLYDGLLPGCTIIRSNVHRYVIDANRDPDGASLYPGQNTTTLCPLTDFDGVDIWRSGQNPSADEIETRRIAYHAPYHAAIEAELAKWFASQDCDEVVDRLLSVGLPAATLINGYMISPHPQIDARGFRKELEHAVTGTMAYTGLPFRLSNEAAVRYAWAAPTVLSRSRTSGASRRTASPAKPERGWRRDETSFPR